MLRSLLGMGASMGLLSLSRYLLSLSIEAYIPPRFSSFVSVDNSKELLKIDYYRRNNSLEIS